MKLIAGLGNPGSTYAHTRHNVGFMVIDRLAASLGVAVEKKQGQALVSQAVYKGERLLLVKPQTYMNLSGDSIMELLNFYKNGIEELIVIHDDMDIELGRVRFKAGGGTGGHRGLKSIAERLGSNEYDRLKVGIGRPFERIKPEVFVLQSFQTEEKLLLDKVLNLAVAGLENWIAEGCVSSMNKFNAQNLAPQPASDQT
ncbi:MAG TPA: aminoacyl-tRNA hydrolase [Peptococcaceae bacterium]|nr:aminoacyl-tRNA hydrolase [Peptococcaceae bacterium]